MATTLGSATVFPISPDGGTRPVLARTFLTNVQQTDAGNEVRAALRSVGVRRLEFTAVFQDAKELGQFRTRWISATERLRFTVPVWPRQVMVTAFPTSTTASGDFAHHDLVVGEATAILHLADDTWELVDIEDVTDDTVTFGAAPSGTYVAGATLLVPVMNAWLDPPTADQKNEVAEQVPLVFREELPGIAGIDPTKGAAETPVAATIESSTVGNGSTWGPKKFGSVRVTVRDDAGMIIPRAPLAWTVTPPAGTPIITFPGDGNVIAAEYVGTSFTGVSVLVESGAASLSFSMS